MNTEDTDNKIEEFCGYITKTRLTRKDLFKTLAIFAGSLVLLSQTENAYAHPPSGIIITFDPKINLIYLPSLFSGTLKTDLRIACFSSGI